MQLTSEFEGLSSFPGFDNYSAQPHNTCGQAVIASILLYADRIPETIRNNRSTLERDLIQHVFERHGPNWPLKNMISNRRVLTRALTNFEVPFLEHVSKPFTSVDSKKQLLSDAVGLRKHPVIVLLDVHRLALGPRFVLHWAVVYAVSDRFVRVSSWGESYDIPWDEFLASWKVWFLPYPYSYYMIEITTNNQ